MTAPTQADVRMAVLGAREISDGETVFVGIGAPCLSAMLARRLHAPAITMVFESGVVGADPDKLPLSTGSPSVAAGARMIGSMLDVFAMLQRGAIDLGILSGAEVDRFGNLNSTVIGPYGEPRLRLPGSGGAHDIALLARRLVIVMPHEPKRFVQRVSFVTSPGHSKERAGHTCLGVGPSALVTSRALFLFDEGEMTLAARFADIGEGEAVEGIPWPVPRRATVEVVAIPTTEHAALARSVSETAP